jgi:hypothetical protein
LLFFRQSTRLREAIAQGATVSPLVAMFEAKMVAQLWRCGGLVSGGDASSARERLITRQADGDEVVGMYRGFGLGVSGMSGMMQMSTPSTPSTFLEEWFPMKTPYSPRADAHILGARCASRTKRRVTWGLLV